MRSFPGWLVVQLQKRLFRLVESREPLHVVADPNVWEKEGKMIRSTVLTLGSWENTIRGHSSSRRCTYCERSAKREVDNEPYCTDHGATALTEILRFLISHAKGR